MIMKGVSPLIATVLLIVIVVSLVAILSGWLTTFFVGTRETVSNRTSSTVSCSGSSLAIDTVYVTIANGTSANAKAVVRNDGVVDGLSIISAQLLNTTGSNYSATSTLPTAGNFNRGAIRTLTFENVSLQSCSAFSQVVVSTECGSVAFKTNPVGC